MKIEILISTLNEGIFDISFSEGFCYLIVHQITDDRDYSDIVGLFPGGVRYFKLNCSGLSVSRNFAIANSIGDFIWIMDDDVEIIDNGYSLLCTCISKLPSFDMLVLNHSNFKNNNIKFDSVLNLRSINYLTAMSVSSIDMLINRQAIGSISFNENFGLGSNYPSGEEYIFTVDMLKNRLDVLKIDNVFSYHPGMSSGHFFYESDIKIKTKLIMFRYCFGKVLGRLLFALFILKKSYKLFKYNKFLTALYILFCVRE